MARPLTAAEIRRLAWSLSREDATALAHDWGLVARPSQRPPAGPWFVWMLRAGRGFGKTRTGAGWVHARAMAGDGRREMLLVSKTPADARDDMIEGPGGILRNTPPSERPRYEPSKRRLVWPTGATARVRSGADPDGIRGFSGDTAWCDELAAWRYADESWATLMLGMREASVSEPRVLVTTTPKPLALLRRIEAMSGTVVVTGSTWENR
ncbi:MAG: terminase family protein, partial [Rubricoccaceae bacterium]|nr:terminase family protein [Rubricoccaceae bacterium]